MLVVVFVHLAQTQKLRTRHSRAQEGSIAGQKGKIVKYSKFGRRVLALPHFTPTPTSLPIPVMYLSPSLCDPSHVTRPLTCDLLPEIMSICEGIFVSEG